MSLKIKKTKDRFCSREYRLWLHFRRCFFCSRYGSDPHHLTSRKWADGSDATCIPVCRNCHNEVHAHKIEPENAAASLAVLQLEFMREHNIEFVLPFTQQDFEDNLRKAGFVQEPFTRRKNR